MIRKLAAFISLAVVFSGLFALSTQSAEAKTSRSTARNYFVPPPPPSAPSIFPSTLAMTNAQAVTADADEAVLEKEVKTSRNSSRKARNYLVPPPPPYTPSMPSTLGMTNARAVTADADEAVLLKAVNLYNKYILTRNQGDMPQVVRSNRYEGYSPGVEMKIQKQIDSFDSEISSYEKEIGKLLNL